MEKFGISWKNLEIFGKIMEKFGDVNWKLSYFLGCVILSPCHSREGVNPVRFRNEEEARF